MENQLISIVVPVYNVEEYLRKCLDSIMEQSFSCFELLLINDGSTDGSGQICQEYLEKDDRIRYFEKENGFPARRRDGCRDAQRDDLWILRLDGVQ